MAGMKTMFVIVYPAVLKVADQSPGVDPLVNLTYDRHQAYRPTVLSEGVILITRLPYERDPRSSPHLREYSDAPEFPEHLQEECNVTLVQSFDNLSPYVVRARTFGILGFVNCSLDLVKLNRLSAKVLYSEDICCLILVCSPDSLHIRS